MYYCLQTMNVPDVPLVQFTDMALPDLVELAIPLDRNSATDELIPYKTHPALIYKSLLEVDS